MNKSFAIAGLVAVTLATASSVRANDYKSVVLSPSETLPTIIVPDSRFLVIRNFTQNGLSSMRGTVKVTIGSQPQVTVLTASVLSSDTTPVETVNSIVIAGPARVDIQCGDGMSCFLSYRKVAE